MSKSLLSAAALAAITAVAATLPLSPATAQRATPGAVFVYGTDPCPRSTESDVVVCYRRPEAERFRIPETLRETGTRQEGQSWVRQADALATAGSTGIGTCTPVGPGGSTGCATQEIKRAFRERNEQTGNETSPE